MPPIRKQAPAPAGTPAAAVSPGNPQAMTSYKVDRVTGHPLYVLTQEEKDFYEQNRHAYESENQWSDFRSDMTDLDRLLSLELRLFRLQSWQAMGMNYVGDDIDDDAIHKQVMTLSDQITKVKTQMALTVAGRNAASGKDSVAAFIDTLLRRAAEFGVHRNQQYALAIALMKDMFSRADSLLRAGGDREEMIQIGHPSFEDFARWIVSDKKAEFDAHDLVFQQNQKMWLQEMRVDQK